jgi:hypothetical protein
VPVARSYRQLSVLRGIRVSCCSNQGKIMQIGNHGDENHSTDEGNQEPAHNGGESNSQLPPTGTAPDPPPSPPGDTRSDENPSKWRENTKLILEILGLIVLIVYTVFSALQWAQIRWTNHLTREALNASNTSLSQTLEKMQGQINEMHRLADETHTANANFVFSDRPWLAITISITDFGPNKTPIKEVRIVNSGKRPALITNFSTDGRYFNAMVETPPYKKQLSLHQLLVPGTHYEAVIDLFVGGILTPQAFAIIESRKASFFSYAKVEYTDIWTGARYYTHACVSYMPATQETSATFVGCEAYNYGI